MASDPTAAGLLLLLVDQPLIDASMLTAIVKAWHDARPAFVASTYGGVTMTPVLFDRSLLPELRGLAGDAGARAILQSHAANGRVLEFPPWRGRRYRYGRRLRGRAGDPGTRSAHDGN